jgi:hypothetical protein
VFPGNGVRHTCRGTRRSRSSECPGELGIASSVPRLPPNARHPIPLDTVRSEVRRLRTLGVARVGAIGFSAGGHLAGQAALTDGQTAASQSGSSRYPPAPLARAAVPPIAIRVPRMIPTWGRPLSAGPLRMHLAIPHGTLLLRTQPNGERCVAKGVVSNSAVNDRKQSRRGRQRDARPRRSQPRRLRRLGNSISSSGPGDASRVLPWRGTRRIASSVALPLSRSRTWPGSARRPPVASTAWTQDRCCEL